MYSTAPRVCVCVLDGVPGFKFTRWLEFAHFPRSLGFLRTLGSPPTAQRHTGQVKLRLQITRRCECDNCLPIRGAALWQSGDLCRLYLSVHLQAGLEWMNQMFNTLLLFVLHLKLFVNTHQASVSPQSLAGVSVERSMQSGWKLVCCLQKQNSCCFEYGLLVPAWIFSLHWWLIARVPLSYHYRISRLKKHPYMGLWMPTCHGWS